MRRLNILYFAKTAELIGTAQEALDLPDDVHSVRDTVDLLAERGGGYDQAFADLQKLRAALDQTMVSLDTPLGDAKELALFPPVTGG